MHFISDLDSILVQERNCVEMVAQWYRAGCCSAVQLSRVQIPVSLISTYTLLQDRWVILNQRTTPSRAMGHGQCFGSVHVLYGSGSWFRSSLFLFPEIKFFIIFYYTGWIVKKWWIQKNSISVSCQKKSMEICVSSTNYTV